MDAQLGKVLDELKKLDLEKNTIVALWGDHGWHLGDHGMWCKHTNYEQATRIPLLVAIPGGKAAHAKALVETVDLYPTLAELAGLPTREGLDGKSFAAVVRGSADKHREFATHVYPRQNMIGRAVRDERYRLVEWKKPGADASTAEYELYDYQADPGETKNLAKSQAELVKTLAARLQAMPEAKPQLKAAAAADAPKRPAAGQDRAEMFARRDANKDGKLTKEEFLSQQPDPKDAPARFTRFDKNSDGHLSKEEFVNGGASK
jgi:iduronate 2-sulfatase